MTTAPSAATRACFAAAATSFAELVGRVPPESWDRPALGEWRVRDLVGHASRALTTIVAYLASPAATGEPLDGPVAYFVGVRGAADHSAIASRGREAGAALGDDPAASVADLARRVMALVDVTPDDAPVGTAAGPMRLIGYLPTRTFELTVHSLDLSRALGIDAPAGLGPAIGECCELAGRIAAKLPRAAELLLALTGRTALQTNLAVV